MGDGQENDVSHEAVGKLFDEKLKFIKMHMKEDRLLRLNWYSPLLMVVHSESESAKTIGMIDSEVEVSPYLSLKPSYQQVHFTSN